MKLFYCGFWSTETVCYLFMEKFRKCDRLYCYESSFYYKGIIYLLECVNILCLSHYKKSFFIIYFLYFSFKSQNIAQAEHNMKLYYVCTRAECAHKWTDVPAVINWILVKIEDTNNLTNPKEIHFENDLWIRHAIMQIEVSCKLISKVETF